MNPDLNQKIAGRLIRRKKRVEAAQKALIAATKRQLPIGTLVIAQLGRASVHGVVVSHNDFWWHGAGDVTIRNLDTDKLRSFSAPFLFQQGDLAIVSLPARRSGPAVQA